MLDWAGNTVYKLGSELANKLGIGSDIDLALYPCPTICIFELEDKNRKSIKTSICNNAHTFFWSYCIQQSYTKRVGHSWLSVS